MLLANLCVPDDDDELAMVNAFHVQTWFPLAFEPCAHALTDRFIQTHSLKSLEDGKHECGRWCLRKISTFL